MTQSRQQSHQSQHSTQIQRLSQTKHISNRSRSSLVNQPSRSFFTHSFSSSIKRSILLVILLSICLSLLPSITAKKVPDCCCETDQLEQANDQLLWTRLNVLKQTAFFRTFKVNLHNPCPYGDDNEQCSLRGCAVCGECLPDEIPEMWKKEDALDQSKQSKLNALKEASKPSNSQPSNQFSSSPFSFSKQPSIDDIEALSAVTEGSLGANFEEWHDEDECLWIVQDSSTPTSPISYINLALNPESYTGYGGDSAHAIWSAIYNENCFRPIGGSNEMCYEQRVFYRLLSGLQSAISAHISNSYPISSGFDVHADINEHPEMYKPNLEVFESKLGSHEDRLQNLYFALVFLLRAVNKATPMLLVYDYSTGARAEDDYVKQLMNDLLGNGIIPTCQPENSFDETLMFRDFAALQLKQQFKDHFRNLSRIMDCVGCEKCRLHGKLQILGLGTACKILFNDHPFQLQRNEIMALMYTLAKFSNAIKIVQDMRSMKQRQQWEMIIGSASIATMILMIMLYRVRKYWKNKSQVAQAIQERQSNNQTIKQSINQSNGDMLKKPFINGKSSSKNNQIDQTIKQSQRNGHKET